MTSIDQPRAPFAMPALGWKRDALAPHISGETIDYHYGKHLKTYVDNLNSLLAAAPTAASASPAAAPRESLESIIRRAPAGPLFNNAAQVWNHTLYFAQLSPTPRTTPAGPLATALERDFGSFEAFREQFAKAALGLFGSGWVWLAADPKATHGARKLEIIASPNAGNPLTQSKNPLMVIDVWEHAYYIDHRNARAASIEAFWKILDWKIAEQRY